MQLVSLQGDSYVAKRLPNGQPGAFRHLGVAPSIQIQLETNTVDHFESESGNRVQDGRLPLTKTATLSMTLDHWTSENLALALYGTSAIIAGSTVTGEVLPSDLADGDFARLANQDVSSVVVTDSAGSPATLTLGTHYEITSAKHGTIKLLGVSGLTQPFKVDYSFAGGVNLAIFDSAPLELWLMVDGVNTAEANAPVKAELYKVIFDPVSSIEFKHNEGYGMLELTGSALYDSTKVGDATLGQFGRMIEMAA